MFAVLLPATSADAAGSEIHVIPRGDHTGFWSEMAIAADGNPMIASYNHGTQSVEVTTCYNPECTRARGAIVATGVPLADIDLAVGSDGLPVIAYTIRGFFLPGGFANVIKCSDAFCQRSRSYQRVFSSFSGDVGNISVDVDQHNNPTVIVDGSYEANGPRFTQLVSCGDPACRPADQRVRGLGVGRGHDVAIGPDGLPVIALNAVNRGARMTIERCADLRCKVRTSESIGNVGSHTPRVASDGKEITVVAVDVKQRAERIVCNASKCYEPQRISQDRVRVVSPNVAYSRAGATVVSYTDSARAGLWFSRCRSTCDRELLVDGDAGATFTRVGVTAREGVGFVSFFVPSQARLGIASVETY